MTLRAPFPYFGGKARASSLIWEAFGNVPNYVEPFAGSLAVLLGRPHEPKVETVNDLDCNIANFWRAVQHDLEQVATFADWPVNEGDLHARHAWLVSRKPSLREQIMADPDYFDAKVAGWWVWGISAWLGSGWCGDGSKWRSKPSVGEPGRGVHSPRQLPSIAKQGEGIHAPTLHKKMPRVGRSGFELDGGTPLGGRKKPRTHRNTGVHARLGTLLEVFNQLAARLRNVRVVCGDWTRVLGRSTLGIDTAHGMTPCGVLLDPPYSHDERAGRLYAEDEVDLADRVRDWAIEAGKNPDLRIALCGYEGEHEMPPSWRCVAWKSRSGWGSADRERIWFSPACAGARQRTLFSLQAAS